MRTKTQIQWMALMALAAGLTLYGCGQGNPVGSSPKTENVAVQTTKVASDVVADALRSGNPSDIVPDALGLTTEQRATLNALRERYKNECGAMEDMLRYVQAGDKELLELQIQVNRDQFYKAFIAILTPAQKVSFERLEAADPGLVAQIYYIPKSPS